MRGERRENLQQAPLSTEPAARPDSLTLGSRPEPMLNWLKAPYF